MLTCDSAAESPAEAVEAADANPRRRACVRPLTLKQAVAKVNEQRAVQEPRTDAYGLIVPSTHTPNEPPPTTGTTNQPTNQLDAIVSSPPLYPKWAIFLSYVSSSAAVAIVFWGGDLWDAAVAAISAAFVALVNVPGSDKCVHCALVPARLPASTDACSCPR